MPDAICSRILRVAAGEVRMTTNVVKYYFA